MSRPRSIAPHRTARTTPEQEWQQAEMWICHIDEADETLTDTQTSVVALGYEPDTRRIPM